MSNLRSPLGQLAGGATPPEVEEDTDVWYELEGGDEDDEHFQGLDDRPHCIQDGLWIGSFFAEQNKARLQEAGITHVLQVAEGLTPSHAADFAYCTVSVMDHPGEDLVAHFVRVFPFIDEALAGGGGVFVHCVAGVSRSATVCIGWLMARRCMTYDDAFRCVHKARPWIMPNPGFQAQLHRFQELGADPEMWRAWRHTHAEPPVAVVSLSDLRRTPGQGM